MFDLHCHILPGIDDGARDLATALKMAETALADGIRAIVCTPHITPGIYDNDAEGIHHAVQAFAAELQQAGLGDLLLYVGADIRITPEMGARIANGQWPSIAGTRYFLFEPDHNVVVPGLVDLARKLLDQGLVPMLTHPERLRWIDRHYDMVHELWNMGCVVQITAGAITGRFGPAAQKWSERMLQDGLVDVIATDAHNMHRRPPLLREGFEAAAAIVGQEAAWRMVHDNPLAMLNDAPVSRHPGKARSKVAARPEQRKNADAGTSLLMALKRKLFH